MKLWYLGLLVFVGCVSKAEPRAKPDFTQSVAAVEVDRGVGYDRIGSAVLVECKPSGNGYAMSFLSAKHVLESVDPSKARVSFYDGTSVKLISVLLDKKLDAVLLKCDALAYRQPVALRTSDILPLSMVYAVGYPLGVGLVVTVGVINYDIANLSADNVLCTACAMYGNSGGGVFSEDGELIGITVSIIGYSNGIVSGSVPHLHLFLPVGKIKHLLENSHG